MQQAETDLLLIANAKSDIKHFRFLYEKYHEAIFRFIHKRTHDMALSSDITADAFVIAMHQLHKYEHRGLPFSAWLYRIAANELNKYFRQNKKQVLVSFDNETYQDFTKHYIETDDYLIEKENKLLQSMLKLNADEQELIALAYTDKLPYMEIASIKSTSEDNIKVKIHRIRQKLKKLFENQKDE